MTERKRRRRELSDDELSLWQQVVRHAKPLSRWQRRARLDVDSDIGTDVEDILQEELESDLLPPSSSRSRSSTPLASKARPSRKPVLSTDPVSPTDPSSVSMAKRRETDRWKRILTETPWGSDAGGATSSVPSCPSSLSPLSQGSTVGIDRRTANRFRRGKMQVEGRLDLHGLTQDQAHIALHGFIRQCSASGARCVIVITGKGARGQGVLRQMVPRWLNGEHLRPLILSFSHAQIPDGGEGALYILLKRHRDR